MTYSIAIPSCLRSETVRDRSLEMLRAGGVDLNRVTVFVPKAELEDYTRTIGDLVAVWAVDYSTSDVDTNGIPTGRVSAGNFIAHHYSAGSRLVEMDDDLRGLRQMVDPKTTVAVDDVDVFIREAFDAAAAVGAFLWGVYPVPNAFFMKHRIATDLKYVPGGIFGRVLRGTDVDEITLGVKNDYERTLRFYAEDRRLCRIDHVHMDTTGYTGAGGLVATRTPASADRACRLLIERYPEWVRMQTRRSRPEWTEIRVADPRRSTSSSVPSGGRSRLVGRYI